MKDHLVLLLIVILLLGGLFFIYLKLKSYFEQRWADPLLSLRERLHDISEIRKDLQRLYLAEHLLKGLGEEITKLSQIFISRRSGKAGERALEESLALLPPHLLKRNLKLNQGEVEFALVLREGKFVPIDSKFIAPEILSKEEISPEEEKELIRRIRARAKELTAYLKDDKTIGFGLMTCPDGLFPFLQRRILEELEKEKILLVPYSLLLPFLLFIHFFWEKFGRTVNRDTLSQGIASMDKLIFDLERDIEKLSRELRSAENLLLKLRETGALLRRELSRLGETSQSSTNSKDTSE